ncbi:MAG: hypothetical protein ACRDSR_13440 [Pseudonocardiaceae bacterium]
MAVVGTEVIATLRRFRLAEDAGRGIDVMQDVMAEHLLDPPIFDTDAVSVTVDLPLTSTVTVAERAWVGEIENRGELRSRDRILLVHAARGRVLTNATARAQLGVDSTHARARYIACVTPACWCRRVRIPGPATGWQPPSLRRPVSSSPGPTSTTSYWAWPGRVQSRTRDEGCPVSGEERYFGTLLALPGRWGGSFVDVPQMATSDQKLPSVARPCRAIVLRPTSLSVTSGALAVAAGFNAEG